MQGSDDRALALRLQRKTSVHPPLGRVNFGTPALQAHKLEPQTPSKAARRVAPGSPVQEPDRAAPGSHASGVSRAPPSSPGAKLTSPGSPSENGSEIQDGRLCDPKRCSCCWASSKANGTGSHLHLCLPEQLLLQVELSTVQHSRACAVLMRLSLYNCLALMTGLYDSQLDLLDRSEVCLTWLTAGPPTWRQGSRAPFAGLLLCNACGIFEARHKQSLLECTKAVRVRNKTTHNPALCSICLTSCSACRPQHNCCSPMCHCGCLAAISSVPLSQSLPESQT